jgi:hypothetical protein
LDAATLARPSRWDHQRVNILPVIWSAPAPRPSAWTTFPASWWLQYFEVDINEFRSGQDATLSFDAIQD